MASQQSTQSSGSREKIGRSKRGNWFVRYCCCCCTCCCSEDDVHRPLLHSTTPKEHTPVPVPADTKEDEQAVGGEETQQVELVVADVEETLDSENEEDKDRDKVEQEKPIIEVDLEPTERARVESGTFVRGSNQRASWRLVPSVTQQVKEARAAAEATGTEKDIAPTNQGNDDDNKQVEVGQIEQGTEQISFKSDEKKESTASDRTVTLVAQDIDDDEIILEEPITMTFTIGSRGNQDGANDCTQETSTINEQKLQGQENQVEGDAAISSATVVREEVTAQAHEEDANLESHVDIDQPTTPILTEQH